MKKIRVAIVEDDPDWLKAMVSFLKKNDDIVVVGTAVSRETSVELVKNVEADVMLMDINLNGNECDGIYACLDILEVRKMKIIMLTSLKNENIIRDAFTAGAVNYITKENYADIPLFIRNCYNDSSPIEIMLKEFRKMKKEEQLRNLSQSEREVFNLMEKGYNYAEIEKKLFKTHNTLRTQIKSILRKMKVSSGKEAILKVNSNGLKYQIK
jgi:NarL family two-component system response regulator LiaR